MRLRSSLLYTCAILGLSATAAAAQTPQPAGPGPAGTAVVDPAPAPAARAAGGSTVQEVVVTGSLIRGTPQTGLLPVAVLGADELQRRGAPALVDLLKQLPVSNGVLGDTNQFDARAQGSEGVGSINLRGLGPQRTLVLINGRRMTVSPFAQGGAGAVNTNNIPIYAIDRLELLKDGAAATYGSDAIAGVVNIITKRGGTGFDVGAQYRYVPGSDGGDYDMNINWGWRNDRADIFLSAGYEHRGELRSIERDFTNRPYLDNPEGGWSGGGNPSPFIGPTLGLVRDPGCETLGGYPGFAGASPRCYFHYINYDNLVEQEDRVQIFGNLNFKLNEHHNFHLDVLGAHTDVPNWKTSPSYLATTGPTVEARAPNTPASLAGYFVVPNSNPGLRDFVAKNPQFAALLTTGAYLAPGTFRPYGVGGNPLFGNGPSRGTRDYTAYRISGGFNGDLPLGMNYDINMGYSKERDSRSGYDTLTDRFQLALRGLGGPNCNIGYTGTPGVFNGTPGANGCMYFNPFSNAIATNAITGQSNPQFNAAVANSPELTAWFFQKGSTTSEASLFTVEGTISGKTPITLPGGPVGFAIGGQYRSNTLLVRATPVGDINVTPCQNTPDFGVVNCAAKTGAFIFLGPTTPADLSDSIYAVYGELQAPIFDNLQAQFAARFEDYGSQTGSTFNPKFSLRWQAIPQFALRGSIGTTFRGPPLSQKNAGQGTSLQFIVGGFTPVDIFGNPNLTPETATTFSVGGIFTAYGIKATLDYFKIDISDGIVAEPVSGIVNSVFPGGTIGSINCASPLINRVTLNNGSGGACVPGGAGTTLGRVRTGYINGPEISNSGLDFLIDYRFPQEVFGGRLSAGAALTYVLEYSVGEVVSGGVTLNPAFDAVGFLNYQTIAYPIPQWKGSFFAEYTRGPHNLRWTLGYTDGYTDQRTAPFVPNSLRDTAGNPVTNTNGKEIGSFVTNDVSYRVLLPYDASLSVTIENIFDEEPPFARLDLSYDPFTANPLGRTFKFRLSKKF